jgi:DNA-binding GntR family transcriptional regulator
MTGKVSREGRQAATKSQQARSARYTGRSDVHTYATMGSGPSPIPLYHRIYTVIRQRIVDGTLPPGSRLPPEDELAAEFDVSRATIRQAVGELVRADMVSRRQGRGTFVLDAAHDGLGQVFRGSLADLIAEVSRTKIRQVSIEHGAQLPAQVARQLQLDDPVGTVVRRIREVDGDAFAYTVNHLPPSVGSLLTRKELQSSGLMQLLEKKGIALRSARQTIRAQVADITVSEALEVALGSPVLFVVRLILGDDGTPLEVVQSWYRGDRYEYTVTFERDGAEADFGHQFA